MALHDIAHQQPFFDQLVNNTNCTAAADPLACLRSVSFEELGNAVNQSPGFFSFSSVQLSWPPTVDGDFIVQDPQVAIQQGAYAKVSSLFELFYPRILIKSFLILQVPIIAGDCDDEGTYAHEHFWPKEY